MPRRSPAWLRPPIARGPRRSIDCSTSISTFEAWTSTTAPHVVFGRVDKDRYARYHALHIADHFAAFAVDAHAGS